MPTKPDQQFIVLWDDGQGVCAPMQWDTDFDGSLCLALDSVALFDSRAAARRAINISAKFAALQVAKGIPANLDFLGKARKNLRIVPCVKGKA